MTELNQGTSEQSGKQLAVWSLMMALLAILLCGLNLMETEKVREKIVSKPKTIHFPNRASTIEQMGWSRKAGIDDQPMIAYTFTDSAEETDAVLVFDFCSDGVLRWHHVTAKEFSILTKLRDQQRDRQAAMMQQMRRPPAPKPPAPKTPPAKDPPKSDKPKK